MPLPSSIVATKNMIRIHKPHPGNYIKGGALKGVKQHLIQVGYLEYKGYLGTIEPELDNDTLYGKIAFIRDLVTYEAINIKTLREEFQFSVDEYLKNCEALGIEPSKSFKGSFNVWVKPKIHQAAVLSAQSIDMNLNSFVEQAMENEIN